MVSEVAVINQFCQMDYFISGIFWSKFIQIYTYGIITTLN